MDDLLLDELLVGSAARSAPSAATQRAPPGAPWRHRASCWRHRHQSGNTLQHRQSRSLRAWFVLLGGVRVLLDDVRHDPWGVRPLAIRCAIPFCWRVARLEGSANGLSQNVYGCQC